MKGLNNKYSVRRRDEYGDPAGPELTNIFVLLPETDPVARKALAFYADMSDNTILRHDIWRWLGNLRKKGV